jgi:isoprenylcysteine carboxyl methyltransferase (ICMT) family protein YpbQ
MSAPTQQPTIMLKLGGRTLSLTGRSAGVVLLVVLVLAIALVSYFVIEKPEAAKSALLSPLWISAGLWILMMVYWSAAAKRTAPARSAESQLSRGRHQMLLDVWAIRCLGRNWSGAVTIKVDHQLIRTGPYRLVRHPIYTAMFGMFLGTAIVGGELHGLLALLICTIAYWRKTRMEERGLRDVFGQAYDDYRRTSWAFIPWLW